ncbi:MAG: hypothetical protein DME19_17595 [Verrucomicrobia bacterium]|nr:MAG: hypothetical protein DME19_17595 [Verrucomicrobiota bacterium]
MSYYVSAPVLQCRFAVIVFTSHLINPTGERPRLACPANRLDSRQNSAGEALAEARRRRAFPICEMSSKGRPRTGGAHAGWRRRRLPHTALHSSIRRPEIHKEILQDLTAAGVFLIGYGQSMAT